MGVSKFPEILGRLSMRKQCVPGSFLPAHAREPGNEANVQYIPHRQLKACSVKRVLLRAQDYE